MISRMFLKAFADVLRPNFGIELQFSTVLHSALHLGGVCRPGCLFLAGWEG